MDKGASQNLIRNTQHSPLIVTLNMDAESRATLTALRYAHFPPERNFLDAHITLFHTLPGEEIAAVQRTLTAVCAETAPFKLRLTQPRFTGRGVALEVESPDLLRLRQRLAADFAPLLTPQDRQGYRPHVTIQNKVTPDQARVLHAYLAATWTPQNVNALGLELYHYRGGPWEFAATAFFSQHLTPNA